MSCLVSRAPSERSHPKAGAGHTVPYLLCLSRLREDQGEEAQTDLLMLRGSFTHLQGEREATRVSNTRPRSGGVLTTQEALLSSRTGTLHTSAQPPPGNSAAESYRASPSFISAKSIESCACISCTHTHFGVKICSSSNASMLFLSERLHGGGEWSEGFTGRTSGCPHYSQAARPHLRDAGYSIGSP